MDHFKIFLHLNVIRSCGQREDSASIWWETDEVVNKKPKKNINLVSQQTNRSKSNSQNISQTVFARLPMLQTSICQIRSKNSCKSRPQCGFVARGSNDGNVLPLSIKVFWLFGSWSYLSRLYHSSALPNFASISQACVQDHGQHLVKISPTVALVASPSWALCVKYMKIFFFYK